MGHRFACFLEKKLLRNRSVNTQSETYNEEHWSCTLTIEVGVSTTLQNVDSDRIEKG